MNILKVVKLMWQDLYRKARDNNVSPFQYRFVVIFLPLTILVEVDTDLKLPVPPPLPPNEEEEKELNPPPPMLPKELKPKNSVEFQKKQTIISVKKTLQASFSNPLFTKMCS